jgi:hypothetical protein
MRPTATGKQEHDMHPSARRLTALLLAGLLSGSTAGCSRQLAGKHRHDMDRHGQVFYLDGAGGGGLVNWGRGVEAGLREAGYRGGFESFRWHTGLGVAADQGASVAYKRGQAAKLAKRIRTYQQSHPGRAVHLVGLSAGTAVAVFTLEALASNGKVDDLVLLGSSISEHYDMTAALRQVTGKAYVYTSEKDAVLSVLVPAAGTADRQFCGACSAGLHGLHLPRGANPETRRLYRKVNNINWKREFEEAGNYGGHTDATKARFVRDYVAPLILADGPTFRDAGRQPMSDDDRVNSAGSN